MIDWLRLAETLISSPWLYAVLIAVSFLDSFLPLIPSEPVVIVAGVYAATGQTTIVFVIAATTLGAFLGDLVPYTAGRLLGARVLKRLPPGSKRRAAHDWFTRELDARGGFVLVTTRFIPVGRYLATLSTGLVRYPLGRYLMFIAFATAAWSAYTALTGYLGGVLFQENTLLAMAVGVGLAFVVTGFIEVVRRVRAEPVTSPQQPRP
ncbi:DedA family protein [Lentzea flaviverrucosa]|uniref:Membrane protein DedA, SNARE-associated domain n=1 Tax=Lentzea flaviverrucosa TaxID=200379 RepID=A0A1H9HEY4_9PSEU|nr:DedA family protein [Lentzea flaviverrucosa]RDI34613.1 membrane protein DedA with SNARE-associated domain [Lentzea flaviverrucosa]SEQ60766.1 membrane protein DedA, SNARE-associated domain [Lentzea flaviverrucosa]